jgi:hypothetical protein
MSALFLEIAGVMRLDIAFAAMSSNLMTPLPRTAAARMRSDKAGQDGGVRDVRLHSVHKSLRLVSTRFLGSYGLDHRLEVVALPGKAGLQPALSGTARGLPASAVAPVISSIFQNRRRAT